jgi:SAM-dependent methyltransferase
MKVISKWRLGNLQGTVYETTIGGETHYVYKVRYNRKVVAQSYVYFKDKDECLKRMNDDLYYLFDGDRSLFNLQDITKMKLPARYDFVTAINDCMNYIPKGKLNAAFKNVRGALKKGGIFLFDISSKGKIEKKVANTVSVDDREEITYLSFNRPEEDGVTMEVTLFTKNADGSYQRLDETHRQYAYTEEEMIAALEQNGFTVLEVEGHLGTDKTTSDRICFLAQKR